MMRDIRYNSDRNDRRNEMSVEELLRSAQAKLRSAYRYLSEAERRMRTDWSFTDRKVLAEMQDTLLFIETDELADLIDKYQGW